MAQQLVPLYPADPIGFSFGEVQSVDLSTGFKDTDEVSVTLPDFPLSSLDLTETKIEFTSNADGNFGVGPTDSIPFSYTTNALVAGDSEMRFPRQLLATVDLEKVTGVRFVIAATANCTFKCMAIRLLEPIGNTFQWI